VIDPSINISQ